MQKPQNQAWQPHLGRGMTAIAYFSFAVVAVRELTFGPAQASRPLIAALLGAFFVLFVIGPARLCQATRYRFLYFVVQTAVIQALGLLPPYQDIWALLYIPIGVQALYSLTSRAAIIWGGLTAVIMTSTFILGVGITSGIGFALTYIAGFVMTISWELFSWQAESARQESQTLLAELQVAHRQLQAYTSQLEELAAAQERDRLAHELHDSVSQMIFSITLTTESARLLLEQDPARALEQLDRLQDLTSSALAQMRTLIAQWRPGS